MAYVGHVRFSNVFFFYICVDLNHLLLIIYELTCLTYLNA